MSAAPEVELIESPLESIPEVVNQARQRYVAHLSWNDKQKREFTLGQLKKFKQLVDENMKELCEAVKADLNKCEVETIMMEVNVVMGDLIRYIRDFDDLVKPRPLDKGLLNKFDDMYLKPEPYGLVLIYGAWNYPFSLVAHPLIGAIAAGNAVVVKPSELSVNTSNFFATKIPQYLDKNYYKVITGGVAVAQTVLKERYDYIMYTGSTSVGKIVMAEAAKNLTPVTLELGGKSPVIIADDANLKIAAKRVMFGKMANSGQTCIAPDYILVTSPANRDKFVDYCKEFVTAFFGENPSTSNDFGRIINKRHFDRVTGLMSSSKGRNVLSGDTDSSKRYIAPAIYIDVNGDDALMQEEIFGPVLPVVTVNGLQEAIKFVNEREKPLAFYVFTESKSTFEKVSNGTSSGALVQNNTIAYAGAPTLPFGGVGNSGFGAYHGEHTFKTFSHMKPILRSGTKMDFLLNVVYPPHDKSKISQANFFQLPSMRRWSLIKPLLLMFLVAAIAITAQIYGIPSWLYNK